MPGLMTVGPMVNWKSASVNARFNAKNDKIIRP